ncbi:hypothetical protein HPB52_021975 [Rhipicephalus sanguineus]|uniref:Uncharacterized protein n=1 Tax=Rhipicephalus sanguineus TaxID=34632 RepID=A0A9D4PNS0_RHISA|nr:hypothetical protein HPB52_021975 [Rhipicephalus sanguineus]
MKINLWPKPEYLDRHVLELTYASPRTYNTSTLEFWISERKTNAKLTGSDAYFESTRLAHSFSDEPFVYDNVLNNVTLSIAAVHAPFYYNDMNKAVNYEGLGAAFLKTLLQAIKENDQFTNVSNYPPEAFFFVSYCHTQSRLNPLFDCNEDLRGTEKFLRAFRCGRGSGMLT